MWLLFPLVFLAGFVDAIAGGGGIISISAYLAVGLPPHLALGTNKLSAFLGAGTSTWRFVRRGHILWPQALASVVGALIGSPLGATLALHLDERILVYLMLIVLPIIAILVLRGKAFTPRVVSLPHAASLVLAFFIGFVLGGYDGFFGPGTGMFLIMAFTSLLGIDILTACGNAKIVNFASNVGAVITFIANGQVVWGLGIPAAACAILGQYLGAGLAMKQGVRVIRPMVLVVIVLLMAKIIWDMVA